MWTNKSAAMRTCATILCIVCHSTGRRCGNCGGKLYDTIIHFSESLPQEPLRKAFEHAEKADLCLVLGSSLTVTPAGEWAPRRP